MGGPVARVNPPSRGPPWCERSVTQGGMGFGLRPAPREQLAADRAVLEVTRVDVDVGPAGMRANLGDEPGADGLAVARVTCIASVGSRQRDHDGPVLVRAAPMDVGRDRIRDVPDREPVAERGVLDDGTEAAGAVLVAGALGAVLGDFVLAV